MDADDVLKLDSVTRSRFEIANHDAQRVGR
jgi:hypothetical protein